MSQPRRPRTRTKTAATRYEMHTLERPKTVGELTTAELREMHARNEVIKSLNEDLARRRDEFTLAERTLQLVISERRQFVRDVCSARNLPLTDTFTVDGETGIIVQTATRQKVQAPEAVPVD